MFDIGFELLELFDKSNVGVDHASLSFYKVKNLVCTDGVGLLVVLVFYNLEKYVHDHQACRSTATHLAVNQHSSPIYIWWEEALDMCVLLMFGQLKLARLSLLRHVDSQLCNAMSFICNLGITVDILTVRHLHELEELGEEAKQVGVRQVGDTDVLVFHGLVIVEHVLDHVSYIGYLANAHVQYYVEVCGVVSISQVNPVINYF